MIKNIEVVFFDKIKNYSTTNLSELTKFRYGVGFADFIDVFNPTGDYVKDFRTLKDCYIKIKEIPRTNGEIPKTKEPIPIALIGEKRMILLPKAEVVDRKGDIVTIHSHAIRNNKKLSSFLYINF